MSLDDLQEELGPELTAALRAKGYNTLTPIQLAVASAEARDKDLRLSSQTGSGKTVAIGILLRHIVLARAKEAAERRGGPAQPVALVVTPTRELAKQVEAELAWLYAHVGVRIASVTGGTSYTFEQRQLGAGPAIVVATPGRLVDHLARGTVSLDALGGLVLDEADRMLEMGFREDLEKIFKQLPEGARTHLVSATFPREIERMADRVQRTPMHLEGTRLGEANEDIDHVLHVVFPHERFSALVNLLLAQGGTAEGQTATDARALVFAKTRAEVGELGDELSNAGFRVATLSGELEQRERTRALNAFKSGQVAILVATDVAARGIDVSAVDRVIHFSAPTEADSYTHRSGRTGRAGRRGTSHVLLAPREVLRVKRVLEHAGVAYRFDLVPLKEDVERVVRDRIFHSLTSEKAPGGNERANDLAQRLLEREDLAPIVERLLAQSDLVRSPAPRDVQNPTPPGADRGDRGDRGDRRDRDGGRDAARDRGRDRDTRGGEGGFVSFRVTWGARNGADARRLLAMVCRRGGIQSRDVGAIRIGPAWSIVDVAANVADTFAKAAAEPDPRDHRVTIRPDRGPPPHEKRDIPTPRASRPALPPPRASRPEVPAARASRSDVTRREAPRPAPSRTDVQRAERASRPERTERPERSERPARPEQPSRPGRPPQAGGNASSGADRPPRKPHRGGDKPPHRKGFR